MNTDIDLKPLGVWGTSKIPDQAIIKNLLKEMGQDKAYILELESSIKDISPQERKEFKKTNFYKEMQDRIAELNKRVRKLNKDNEDLIMKLNGTKKL